MKENGVSDINVRRSQKYFNTKDEISLRQFQICKSTNNFNKISIQIEKMRRTSAKLTPLANMGTVVYNNRQKYLKQINGKHQKSVENEETTNSRLGKPLLLL